jgi:hypothetical protein
MPIPSHLDDRVLLTHSTRVRNTHLQKSDA